MAKNMLRSSSLTILTAVAICCLPGTLPAQLIRAPLDEGFARTSSIEMSVDEMLGPRKERAADEPIVGPGYPHLRIAEVQFKPVRLMRIPVMDSQTGRTATELVWYMPYRVIARDYTEIAGDGRDDLLNKLEDPETDPANTLDEPRSVPLRMPRFLLVSEDEGVDVQYVDEVNPQIQAAVFRREFSRRAPDLKLLNSVEAITELFEEDTVPSTDPNPLDRAAYGVAVWRNVDPSTDFFSVYMSGFCNAYKIFTADDGSVVVAEKVIQQKFARPGDEFLQVEKEFRLIDSEDLDGDGAPDVRYPRWIYRPRPAKLNVPALDTVLRNASAAPDSVDQ
jgi:hypothetical protein